MPNREIKPESVPRGTSQLSLCLRLLGGGYLVYLAWGLLTQAEGRLDAAAGAVFAASGAALILFSARSLLRGDFIRPGEPADGPAQEPEDIGKEV